MPRSIERWHGQSGRREACTMDPPASSAAAVQLLRRCCGFQGGGLGRGRLRKNEEVAWNERARRRPPRRLLVEWIRSDRATRIPPVSPPGGGPFHAAAQVAQSLWYRSTRACLSLALRLCDRQ